MSAPDELLEAIRVYWCWSSMPPPVRVLSVSRFGNVLVLTAEGSVWLISPEDLSCAHFAANELELDAAFARAHVRDNWEMTDLVSAVEARLGVAPPGRCYYLVMPAALGGKFHVDNVRTIRIAELIRLAGDIGSQIKDLPDGASIELKIVD